jgi:hypothetical protein
LKEEFMYDDDEPETSYLTDMELSVISTAELESLCGGGVLCPEDETPSLLVSNFGHSWVLIGGRTAARAFASRILDLFPDEGLW